MKKSILALAAMAITGTAVAGPNWTYVDAGYVRGSSGNEDTDGFSLQGSVGFAEIWHAQLDYSDGEANGGKSSGGTDNDGYTFTVGVNPAVSDTTDLVFDLSYFDIDNDTASSSSSVDGYGLGVGLRTMWTDQLEVNGGAEVVSGDAGGSNSDFTNVIVSVGGVYSFTDNVAVSMDVANGGIVGGNAARFGVRWNF